jgi:hypothetical protein
VHDGLVFVVIYIIIFYILYIYIIIFYILNKYLILYLYNSNLAPLPPLACCSVIPFGPTPRLSLIVSVKYYIYLEF